MSTGEASGVSDGGEQRISTWKAIGMDEEEGKENKKGKGNGNWKEREEKGKVNGRQES